MNKNFTMVDNSVLNALLCHDLNCTEIKVVLAIIRYTNGYNKEQCTMSYSYISEFIRKSERMVNIAIDGLCKKNIITKTSSDSRSTNLYTVNPPEKWISYETDCISDMKSVSKKHMKSISDNKYKYINKNLNKYSAENNSLKHSVPTPRATAFSRYVQPSGIDYKSFEINALKKRLCKD